MFRFIAICPCDYDLDLLLETHLEQVNPGQLNLQTSEYSNHGQVNPRTRDHEPFTCPWWN